MNTGEVHREFLMTRSLLQSELQLVHLPTLSGGLPCDRLVSYAKSKETAP